MSDKRIPSLWPVAFAVLSFMPFQSFAQVADKGQGTDKVQPADTINYIPAWYFGALDYNLMIAASKGLASEIDRLIKLGANINAYNDDGTTPLIFAVSYNQLSGVKALLRHSPHLDDITANSETALMIAVKNNYTDIAETLIRAGAEIDFTDRIGTSPLHYASLYGLLDMVGLLLYYEAPVDARSDDGITALHAAVWAGNIDVADLLIQNGANMEARDSEGYTPFLIAASFGDTLIMEMLYKYGVDIYTRNMYNHNALTLAITFGHKEAVAYILRMGSRWKEADSLGFDPYKVAAKYSRKEIAEILKNNNVPGKLRLNIDQVTFSGSARFTPHDYYSGFSVSFKEPYLNAGFSTGIDMKLWYTRILIEESADNYFQYYDKGAMFWAGIFKDFFISEKPNGSNFKLSTSLSGGYSFGNKFKGTEKTPDNSFKIIPGIALKWTRNPITVFTGAEYINSEYYKIGPLWFRIGVSYNYYFDNIRTKLKNIRWN